MSCACSDFRAPLRTWEDVLARDREGKRIAWTLEKLGETRDDVELFRCRVCGQSWQATEDRSGEVRALYQIPNVEVEAWRKNPFRDQLTDAATRSWILSALEKLGRELGPETCAKPNCEQRRIAYGVLCPTHHVESLQRVGQLPPWPPEEE